MNHLYDVLEVDNSEVLVLASVKHYLRVTHDHDDELLRMLICSSIEAAEHYIRYSISKRIISLIINKYHGDSVDLRMGMLQRVRKLSIADNAIDVSEAELSNDRIVFPQKHQGKLEMIYEVGYQAHDSIPQAILQGIMRHVAEMYDREGELLGMPEECIKLYTPYRLMMI